MNGGYLHVSEKTGYKVGEILKMSIAEYYGLVAGIVYNNDEQISRQKKFDTAQTAKLRR